MGPGGSVEYPSGPMKQNRNDSLCSRCLAAGELKGDDARTPIE